MPKTQIIGVLLVTVLLLLGACAPAPALPPTPAPTPAPPREPELNIFAEVVDCSWVRGYDDLPTYQVTIYHEVTNNDWAGEVLVTLPSQETPTSIDETTIGIYLEPYDREDGYLNLYFPLGIPKSGAVRFSATAGSLYAVKDVMINAASLPRSTSYPEILELYITPHSSYVRQLLAQILANKPILRTEFGAIQQWVDLNIAYNSDYSLHGASEYYQLPFETASSRSGDCEDYAILLCSLLRAYGIPAEEVYVAFGFNADGTIGHAYLIEHWYYNEWRVIEPRSSFPLLTDIESWLVDLEYEDVCYFNDLYYVEVK